MLLASLITRKIEAPPKPCSLNKKKNGVVLVENNSMEGVDDCALFTMKDLEEAISSQKQEGAGARGYLAVPITAGPTPRRI